MQNMNKCVSRTDRCATPDSTSYGAGSASQ